MDDRGGAAAAVTLFERRKMEKLRHV